MITLSASGKKNILFLLTTILLTHQTIRASDKAQALHQSDLACADSDRIYVNHGNPNPGDGNSWANSMAGLAEALQKAQLCENITEIYVAGGTYFPAHDFSGNPIPPDRRQKTFSVRDGLKIFGGFSGNELDKADRIAGTNETILSGDIGIPNDNTDNCYHVVVAINNTGGCILDGLTISRGRADGDDWTSGTTTVLGKTGGGMYNHASKISLFNILFKSNESSISGGGVANLSSTADFVKCTFNSNKSGKGGAVFNEESQVSLSGSLLHLNSAQEGGAVYNRQSVLSITNSLVYQNRAILSGAGIMSQASSTASLRNNTLVENAINGPGNGVAAYFDNSSGGTIRNCVVWNNISTTDEEESREEIDSESSPSVSVSYSIVRNLSPNTRVVNEGHNSLFDPFFTDAVAPFGADRTWMTADDGLRLGNCSIGINGGNNADIPAGTSTDIAGRPRIQHEVVDMGPYESPRVSDDYRLLPDAYRTVTLNQNPSGSTTFASDCENMLAIVTTDPLDPTPLSGQVTVTVWVEEEPVSYLEKPYVSRHYEINPVITNTLATARVTLYFTQQEFDNFNLQNNIRLPRNRDDRSAITNLRIGKFPGKSSDGSGKPQTYSGPYTLIDPEDTDIVWNNRVDRWEITFPVRGFSGFIVIPDPSVLPVTLVNFAVKKNERDVVLNWETSTEINVDFFEIERSKTSTDFEVIGRVNAAGDTSHLQKYSYTDLSWENHGSSILYYRLRTVDRDDSYRYSNIVSISIPHSEADLSVYPLPADQQVTLKIEDSSGFPKKARFVDMTGRIAKKFEVSTNRQTFDVRELPSGTYFIEIENTGVLKLIK